MRISDRMRRSLMGSLMKVPMSRPADFVIGDDYLYRWYLIRRSDNVRVGGAYLHCIVGDDDDRAMHDHPWVNMSIVLDGSYWEYEPSGVRLRRAGDVVCRRPRSLHQLAVNQAPVWTLFLFGPKVRTWGFQCPQGWVPWYEFVDPEDPGKQGPGCGGATL